MRSVSGDNMLRKFALIVAVGSAMFISAAYALGLGDIDVDSRLNQKFSASIPLNSISPDEAENLLVRLADNDDFNKAGIERSDYLSTLNFKVVTDAKSSRIVITSKQLAREPFLSFLLDVRSSTGRVLREYTVLLDPPSYTQPAPVAPPAAPVAKAPNEFYQTAEEANQSKPVATPTPTPAPAPAAPVVAAKPAAPAKPAPAAAPAAEAPVADTTSDTAPSTYGPVKAQETFWSIASKLRPNPSVTMDQMLWGLYNANPQAFEGKRITGLLKGATLKVPALNTITAVSPAAAKEHLQALQGHRTGSIKKAAPVAAVEEPAPAPAAAPKPEPAHKAATQPAVPEKKTPEAVAPPPPVAAPAKPAAPAPAPAPAAKVPAQASTPAPAPTAPETAAPAPATTPESAPADQAAAATPAAVPAEPAAEAPAPVPAPKPVKKPVTPASSAFADDWMAPAIAGALVLVLALLGIRFWQKRQAEKGDSAAPVLTSKASSNLQFWKRAAESAPSAVIPDKFAAPPPLPSASPKPPVAKSILDVPPPPPKPSNPLWDDTVAEVAAATESSFDLTQTMDRHGDTASKFEATSVDEFNSTNQFDTDAGKGGHEANDPISEADFHLAYGLYDEAALLLESAVEKNPGRSDIRVKLAETYFRANKPHEFDDVAQSLKPQLDEAEWQKVAIMGSQLLPESPLYKGAAGAPLEDSVDLAFDEPIDLGAAETQIFSTTATTPAAAHLATGSRPSSSSSSVLDFKLEDLEAPQVSKPPPPAPAKGAESNTLEFNLSDFDLTPPSSKATTEPAPATATATQAPASPAAQASNAVEFDLGGFDLEGAKPAGEAGALGEDINLDDFDLGELAGDSHAISAGDEAGTKLDLARAYVDMGDNEMARSLLTEVLMQGSEDQKNEAQALIQRLA